MLLHAEFIGLYGLMKVASSTMMAHITAVLSRMICVELFFRLILFFIHLNLLFICIKYYAYLYSLWHFVLVSCKKYTVPRRHSRSGRWLVNVFWLGTIRLTNTRLCEQGQYLLLAFFASNFL